MPRSAAVRKETPKPAIAQPHRRVRPVRSHRQTLEAAEQTVGQDRPREMPARGKARIEAAHIEPVERVSKEKLELLAFMEEMVTVLVHESTNPNDEPIPEVWNDGVAQRFIRGQEQRVKRKYVEVLARAKMTSYKQVKLPDNRGYKNIPQTALRYPFSVIEDSQKGKDWLKRVLAEA